MDTSIFFNLRLKKSISILGVLILFSNAVYSLSPSIYRIQSLFLYNFSKHVKWEATSSETFTIGIFGNNEALKEIKENLEDKMVWGKEINVIEISSAQDMSQCHIAYMPKSNRKKIVSLIASSDLSNTLLVTEDDLMDNGAAISFILEQSKLKFKISKSKIEEAGLKVSSSLISIGIPV